MKQKKKTKKIIMREEKNACEVLHGMFSVPLSKVPKNDF